MLYLLKPEILAGYVKQFEITFLHGIVAFLFSNQSVQAAVILLVGTSTVRSFLLLQEAGAGTLAKTLSVVYNWAAMGLWFQDCFLLGFFFFLSSASLRAPLAPSLLLLYWGWRERALYCSCKTKL